MRLGGLPGLIGGGLRLLCTLGGLSLCGLGGRRGIGLGQGERLVRRGLCVLGGLRGLCRLCLRGLDRLLRLGARGLLGLGLQCSRLGGGIRAGCRELLQLLGSRGFGTGQCVAEWAAQGRRTGQAHAALLGASLAAAPDSVRKTSLEKLPSARALSGASIFLSPRICATAGIRVSNCSPMSQAV